MGKRSARALALVALLAISGLAWVVTAELTVERAARGRVYASLAQVPAKKTVIVLGARVFEDGSLSSVLADRVQCAADLFAAGKVERVLVSGDHGKRAYDEVSAMADALAKVGVPARQLFRDHAGFRTLDTMHRAREVFRVEQAILCTQLFHLPRSIYLARQFGIDAVGLIADRRVYRGAFYNTLRERAAVSSALLDVVFGRTARLLGAPHPIDGDGRSTDDRATRARSL